MACSKELEASVIDPQDMMVKAMATLAKELAVDGAKRLAGPWWDPLGKRIRRGIFGPRAEEVVTGAAHTLAQAGQEPQRVSGRILFDLVQHASIEEDENLHGKWVALLANAGSPTEANKVLPSYVDTLRQLTPKQAEMLDWMHSQE